MFRKNYLLECEILEEDKPKYIKHKDADWSGCYYGEALEKYFPRIPRSTSSETHWSFKLNLSENYYHPYQDLYVFYIKKDLKEIKMEDKAKFGLGKKPSIKIILRRISVLAMFRKYCSKEIKDLFLFLLQPVYDGFILT